MPFTSDLVVRALNGDKWALKEPLVYEFTDDADRTQIYVVPAGFVTDLASIPRILRPIFPVNDEHRPAAALHDYLYASGEVPRNYADRLFLVAMRDIGVTGWKRLLLWGGVRIGGWVPWRRWRTR